MPVDPVGTVTHRRVDSRVALSVFAEEARGFDAAFATVRERRESWLTIAGHRIRLRVAGGAIADAVVGAFAHPDTPPEHGEVPALGIDVWDESEAHTPWPVVDAWDRVRSEDGRLFQDVTPCVSGWLDRATDRLVARVTCAARLEPADVIYQPFSNLLALCLADRAAPTVHAGAVGRTGRAVIVAGRSGAGKSTVSLSCLVAGFDYLGDDFVVLSTGGATSFSVHSVYSTAHLDPEHLKRFPSLESLANPRAPDQGKAVIRIGRAFPARLSRRATVQAIVLPRFVPDTETVLLAAPKAAALMAMASSLFARPAATPAAFHALAGLVDAVPAYWLETGRDVSAIPRALESLLPIREGLFDNA